jgi:hypothetical protein
MISADVPDLDDDPAELEIDSILEDGVRATRTFRGAGISALMLAACSGLRTPASTRASSASSRQSVAASSARATSVS